MTGSGLAVALVGFNIGIDVSQIAVALIVLPAMYMFGKGTLLLWLGIAGLYWIWEWVIWQAAEKLAEGSVS